MSASTTIVSGPGLKVPVVAAPLTAAELHLGAGLGGTHRVEQEHVGQQLEDPLLEGGGQGARRR